MPTYYFECSKCKASVSVNNPISDNVKVPVCYGCELEMVRQFTAPAVSFKGIGWGKDR